MRALREKGRIPMNTQTPDPDSGEADPGMSPLEARIRAVPFRGVPEAWRATVLSAAVPAGVADRTVAGTPWWRELLPGVWMWRAAMAAWALVLLLNWDAGRRGVRSDVSIPLFTMAELRTHLALRRDVLATLVEAPEPEPRSSPDPRIPGPQSARQVNSFRNLGRRRKLRPSAFPH